MSFRSRTEMNTASLPLSLIALGLMLSAPVSAADDPRAPADLRASVYSSNVFELFWDRESEPLIYEIYDSAGVLLATTEGTSFFFDNEPAFALSDASIDVVSVDLAGNRSAPSSVTVDTANDDLSEEIADETPADDPFIDETDVDDASEGDELVDETIDNGTSTDDADGLFTVDGGQAMLEQIHDLVLENPGNREVLERFNLITDGQRFDDLLLEGFVIVPISSDSNSGEQTATSESRVDCPEGGSYLVNMSSTRSGRNLVYEYDMHGCVFDGVRHNGRVFSHLSETYVAGNFKGTFSDYSLEYADGRRVTLDTGWKQPGADVNSQIINLVSNMNKTIDGSYAHRLRGRYAITEADGNTTIVENALIDWSNPTHSPNCLQLSMRITAPWTGYESMQIDTYDDNWVKGAMCDESVDTPFMSTGILSISNGQGSSVTLDPVGGASYDLLVSDAPGHSYLQTGFWWADSACVWEKGDDSVSCEGVPPLF